MGSPWSYEYEQSAGLHDAPSRSRIRIRGPMAIKMSINVTFRAETTGIHQVALKSHNKSFSFAQWVRTVRMEHNFRSRHQHALSARRQLFRNVFHI